MLSSELIKKTILLIISNRCFVLKKRAHSLNMYLLSLMLKNMFTNKKSIKAENQWIWKSVYKNLLSQIQKLEIHLSRQEPSRIESLMISSKLIKRFVKSSRVQLNQMLRRSSNQKNSLKKWMKKVKNVRQISAKTQ